MKVYDADGNEVAYIPPAVYMKPLPIPTEAPVSARTLVHDDGRITTVDGHEPCDAAWGVPRSGHWSKVRKTHLEANPTCLACGATKLLNVHHVRPFHLFPELELEPGNLVTLCESLSHNCHFYLGHLLDWRSHNTQVWTLARKVAELIKGRP